TLACYIYLVLVFPSKPAAAIETLEELSMRLLSGEYLALIESSSFVIHAQRYEPFAKAMR
ncbi:MAG: hypothetical protein AAF226_18355, partial [Verrucomicrobiota bacterium]